MLNFFALEPKEFAALSCDILQRFTGKTFHLTDGPYDEGIDFIHGPDCCGIVGQAKHYINSSVEQLFRDLRQEMERVRRLRPKAYYLFLSKDLTPRRLMEAVEMFQAFTTFDQEHIFALSRIDALLQGGKYRDILDKYPKLWNFSMDVLGRALYRNVDFDMREILLKSHSCSEFVPTGSYCACIDGLEEAHVVLLQGAPGAGKTMISQQAALELARQNYRVYWTTDGNLRDVKGILSDDDTPELVVLDDFLGQMYITLDPSRAAELETLLSFVRRSKSKRLLLNSRITILQDAERRTPFSRLISGIPRVDVDNLTAYEKARILRSHLDKHYADSPEVLHYFSFRERYWRIVRHSAFNPRIIGMMADLPSEPLEPEDVYARLLRLLDDPKNIWKQEFEENLCPGDRILLTTLYSLTNEDVDFELLKTCYTARLLAAPEVDKTIDHLENALTRLNRSMLRQEWGETRKLGVLNPSVSDFLREYIRNNPLEQEAITASAIYFEQIGKVLREDTAGDPAALRALVERRFEDHSILNLHFLKREHWGNILAYLCIVQNPLRDDVYREPLLDLLREGEVNSFYPFPIGSSLAYIQPLFSEPLFSYYEMADRLSDNAFIQALIRSYYPSIGDILQCLSLIWSVLFAPDPKNDYDLTFFRREAAERVEEVLLREADFEAFLSSKYDPSEFDRLVLEIDSNMPVDDVIDYLEGDLAVFLWDDLSGQYAEYVLRCIREVLKEQPWFDGVLNIDVDDIFIDQNIDKHVDFMVDNAMYHLLPEEDYDAYTARRREQSDNFYQDRAIFFQRNTMDDGQNAQIRALYEE